MRDTEIERNCLEAREEYLRCLQNSKLHATRKRFHYSQLSNEPWRKLAIGSANGLGDPYAQNLQSIYFASNDRNYPALSSLFNTMLLILESVDGCRPVVRVEPRSRIVFGTLAAFITIRAAVDLWHDPQRYAFSKCHRC